MTNETSRRRTGRRTGRRWWSALCLLSLGGCSFLADEFSWLDRAAPSSLVAPDAPPSGTERRP